MSQKIGSLIQAAEIAIDHSQKRLPKWAAEGLQEAVELQKEYENDLICSLAYLREAVKRDGTPDIAARLKEVISIAEDLCDIHVQQTLSETELIEPESGGLLGLLENPEIGRA